MAILSHDILQMDGDNRPPGPPINMGLHRSFDLETRAHKGAIRDWGPLTTHNTSPGRIATLLHLESESKLKILFSFEAVVQAANQGSPTIQLLCHLYDKLSAGLFMQLKSFPTLIETLDQVIKELYGIESDPFLYEAIKNACYSAATGKYRTFNPRLHIIDDIHYMLTQTKSSEELNEKLEVLRARFQRQYHKEVGTWKSFNVQTKFLDDICQLSPRCLAVRLSEKDCFAFRDICPRELIDGDSRAHGLKKRWSRLANLVSDCMITGQNRNKYFTQLIEDLVALRNLYSATAVIEGMIQSSCPTQYAIERYRHLVSSDDNNKAYRDLLSKMEGISALHFVCRTKSDEITHQIASASAAYTIEGSARDSSQALDLVLSKPLDAPADPGGHPDYSSEAIHPALSNSGDASTNLGYCGRPENVMKYAKEENCVVHDTGSQSYISWLLSCFKP